MGKVIQFKPRKNNKASAPVEDMQSPVVPTDTNKGWHFGSIDESDTAVILRAIAYLMAFVFGTAFIFIGFEGWIKRGLFATATCFALSYLLLLRRK